MTFISLLTSVVDPDPHGSEIFACIRIRNYCSGFGSSKIWKEINKNVISLWIPDFVYCRAVVWNRKWQIDDRFFFMIEFKVVLFTISKYTSITWVGSLSGFRAGSGSGKNHSGSTTLLLTSIMNVYPQGVGGANACCCSVIFCVGVIEVYWGRFD